MTLLITVFAAVFATAKWYRDDDSMRLGILCILYWGAALMWMIDAVFEYMELRAAYFTPSAEDMLNDTFLGLSVVALGLVIWVIQLLIADPKRRVRGLLKREAVKGSGKKKA